MQNWLNLSARPWTWAACKMTHEFEASGDRNRAGVDFFFKPDVLPLSFEYYLNGAHVYSKAQRNIFECVGFHV